MEISIERMGKTQIKLLAAGSSAAERPDGKIVPGALLTSRQVSLIDRWNEGERFVGDSDINQLAVAALSCNDEQTLILGRKILDVSLTENGRLEFVGLDTGDSSVALHHMSVFERVFALATGIRELFFMHSHVHASKLDFLKLYSGQALDCLSVINCRLVWNNDTFNGFNRFLSRRPIRKLIWKGGPDQACLSRFAVVAGLQYLEIELVEKTNWINLANTLNQSSGTLRQLSIKFFVSDPSDEFGLFLAALSKLQVIEKFTIKNFQNWPMRHYAPLQDNHHSMLLQAIDSCGEHLTHLTLDGGRLARTFGGLIPGSAPRLPRLRSLRICNAVTPDLTNLDMPGLTELVLEKISGDKSTIAGIALFLARTPNLISLQLIGYPIGFHGLAKIFRVVEEKPVILQSLGLTFAGIEREVKSLSSVLQFCTNFTLHGGGGIYGNKPAAWPEYFKMFSSLVNNKGLKRLGLNNFAVDLGSFQWLREMLNPKSSNLTVFCLESCDIESNAAVDLIRWVKNHPSLLSISVSASSPPDGAKLPKKLVDACLATLAENKTLVDLCFNGRPVVSGPLMPFLVGNWSNKNAALVVFLQETLSRFFATLPVAGAGKPGVQMPIYISWPMFGGMLKSIGPNSMESADGIRSILRLLELSKTNLGALKRLELGISQLNDGSALQAASPNAFSNFRLIPPGKHAGGELKQVAGRKRRKK